MKTISFITDLHLIRQMLEHIAAGSEGFDIISSAIPHYKVKSPRGI